MKQKKMKQSTFPSKSPLKPKEDPHLAEFIDAFCEDFIENENSSQEAEFIQQVNRNFAEDTGDSYEILQSLELELIETNDAKKKKEIQESITRIKHNEELETQKWQKVKNDFIVDLEKNGWTKEPQFNELQDEYRGKKPTIRMERLKIQEELATLEKERLKFARKVYLDRHPEVITDFCKRKHEFIPICDNLPKYMPTIKEKVNQCFEENEEVWEEAASEDQWWSRQRMPH